VACEPDDRKVDVTYEEAGLPIVSGRRTEGVVLVDRGSIVWWSAAVEACLQVAGLRWTRGMSCCEALQCAANDDGACLSASALDAEDGLVARPWRAGDGDRCFEATLAGRRLRLGGGMSVFELQDLRAGACGAAPRERDVRVSALGRLSVSVGGRLRDGDWLQQRPGQVFRYLLASREAAQRSEAIASALWPERGPSAVANVRYCVFKLREQLSEGPDPSSSMIARDAAGYRIDMPRVELDVDEFQSKAAAGIAAHRGGDSVSAEATLSEALALYRGEFLADDPYADWAFSEREYLRSLAGKGLAAMAQMSLAAGRLVSAADHLQRLAQLEPFDSHVHQMLIEVCLRRGRRTEALRHYHALRARLHRAFGEQPDFEMTSVAAGLACRQRDPAAVRAARVPAANLVLDVR
jgi:DNA-binding SARP family transcriptional activator